MITRRVVAGSCKRGFTLLELLIALAVSAMLLAVLSQTIGSLQLAGHRAIQADAAGGELERGRQMGAALLAAALPPAPGDDDAGFVGRPDGAEFTAAPPEALSRLGPLRVRLMVAPMDADQLGLFAEVRSARSGETAVPAIRRDLLMGGLKWARLAYSAGSAGALTVLQDKWLEPSRLPALVQVRWQLIGEDKERQPLTVSIRRNLAGGCRFDPISLTCRGNDGR